jgi:hypothetical protein
LIEAIKGGRTDYYTADKTTLGFPALFQTETNLLRFWKRYNINSLIGYTCALNTVSIDKMEAAIAPQSSTLGINQIYAHWVAFSEAKIPKCGGNIRRTQFLRARLVTRVSKVGSTEIFMNNLVSAQVCKAETSVKQSSMWLLLHHSNKFNTGPAHGAEKFSNGLPFAFQTSQTSSAMISYLPLTMFLQFENIIS